MRPEGAEDQSVTNDLDTLLTALYVHIEDRVFPALGWSRDHRRDASRICPMPS
jgi:hypothetical protein